MNPIKAHQEYVSVVIWIRSLKQLLQEIVQMKSMNK